MSVKLNIIANYLGQGWSAFVGLVFIPIYIKYLGIEAYGLIGFFTVVQSLLSLLDLGMTPTLGREMAKYTAGAHTAKSVHDLLLSLKLICFALALIIGFGFWLVSGWMADSWFRSEQLPMDVVAQTLLIMG